MDGPLDRCSGIVITVLGNVEVSRRLALLDPPDERVHRVGLRTIGFEQRIRPRTAAAMSHSRYHEQPIEVGHVYPHPLFDRLPVAQRELRRDRGVSPAMILDDRLAGPAHAREIGIDRGNDRVGARFTVYRRARRVEPEKVERRIGVNDVMK